MSEQEEDKLFEDLMGGNERTSDFKVTKEFVSPKGEDSTLEMKTNISDRQAVAMTALNAMFDDFALDGYRPRVVERAILYKFPQYRVSIKGEARNDLKTAVGTLAKQTRWVNRTVIDEQGNPAQE